MRFFHSILFFAALLATSCSKSDRQANPRTSAIRIVPEIQTRVTDTDFEQYDAIGVSIRKEDGTQYLENRYFSYDGLSFSAIGVEWYPETEKTATITAYYPYAETETGQPGTFTVKTDQRDSGYALSDLLGATRTGVKPAISPIDLMFYHLLAKIDIVPQVPEGITIERVIIGGFAPTAYIDMETLKTLLAAGAAAREITAREVTVNKAYDIILPPQKTTMYVTVETSAGLATKEIPNVTLLQGKRYTLQMDIAPTGELDEIRFTGQIQDWGTGNVIEQDPDDENIIVDEPLNPDQGEAGGGVELGGIRYTTRVIDGKEWMTENLFYAPTDAIYFTDYWYPQNRADKISELGILYSYRTAMAGEAPVLNDAATIRGICPEGWRLPTIGELVELAKTVGKEFFAKSGFYYMNYDGDGYNDVRNYILSSTHPDEEHVQYLRIPNIGDTESQKIQTWTLPTGNIASSVRCVKQ